MKIYLRFLIFLFFFNPLQAQDKVIYEKEHPFKYSQYYDNVLPLIGKAYNTLNSIGFNVNTIMIHNYVGNHINNQYDYNELADIRFYNNSDNTKYQSFKRWILFNFISQNGLNNFEDAYIKSWKKFSSPIFTKGYITLPVILMDDSIKTNTELNSFKKIYNTSSSVLPPIFYKYCNIFSFIKSVTEESFGNDKFDTYRPRIESIIYSNVSRFGTFDTLNINYKYRESLSMSYRDTNIFEGYFLRFYDFNSDFLLPTDMDSHIIEKEEICNSKFNYIKLKMETTAQPEQVLLGQNGVKYVDAIKTYEYITILKLNNFVIQLDKGLGYPGNSSSNPKYDKNEIERLLNEIIKFINNNSN